MASVSLHCVFSLRKTSNHLCQAEKVGEGRAIAVRQGGEAGGKHSGCKGRAWKTSHRTMSSPARRLQCASASPAATTACATRTAREWVRRAKSDKREDWERKRTNKKWCYCFTVQDTVCRVFVVPTHLQKDAAALEKTQRSIAKEVRRMEQFLLEKLSYRPKLFSPKKGQLVWYKIRSFKITSALQWKIFLARARSTTWNV